MRVNVFVLGVCVFLVVIAMTVPASAALRKWDGSDITKVLNRTKTIRDAVVDEIKGRVKKMKTNLDDAKGTVTGEVLDLIDAATDAMQSVASETDLADFLASGEADNVRQDLKDLIACIASVIDSSLEFSLGFGGIPCILPARDPVTLQVIINLIDKVPDMALYPLYRALEAIQPLLDAVGPTLLCVKEHIDDLADLLAALKSDEVDYVELCKDAESMAALKGLKSVAQAASMLCKLLGKLFSGSSQQFKLGPEGGVWGWAGVNVQLESVHGFGYYIRGVADVLDPLAAFIGKSIIKAETACFRATVLANQEEILSLLKSSPLVGKKKKNKGK